MSNESYAVSSKVISVTSRGITNCSLQFKIIVFGVDFCCAVDKDRCHMKLRINPCWIYGHDPYPMRWREVA